MSSRQRYRARVIFIMCAVGAIGLILTLPNLLFWAVDDLLDPYNDGYGSLAFILCIVVTGSFLWFKRYNLQVIKSFLLLVAATSGLCAIWVGIIAERSFFGQVLPVVTMILGGGLVGLSALSACWLWRIHR